MKCQKKKKISQQSPRKVSCIIYPLLINFLYRVQSNPNSQFPIPEPTQSQHTSPGDIYTRLSTLACFPSRDRPSSGVTSPMVYLTETSVVLTIPATPSSLPLLILGLSPPRRYLRISKRPLLARTIFTLFPPFGSAISYPSSAWECSCDLLLMNSFDPGNRPREPLVPAP